ncbi:hypothetical protein [Longimycelium tulufanense]|nr:hypothetical protein [Longimycelium tulufanense]
MTGDIAQVTVLLRNGIRVEHTDCEIQRDDKELTVYAHGGYVTFPMGNVYFYHVQFKE